MSWSAVGVDAGGTKIAAARAEDGTIEALKRLPTPVASAAAVIDAIAATVAAVHRPGLPIGIGIAGQIDRRSGVVLSSPNLPGRRVPLAAALEDRFGAPVVVDNDVTLAAFGELGQLDAIPAVLVALFLGTGIGAGVVLGGVPLAGAHNLAAEAGHATFRAGGELCNCGRKGCFEAYAGGLAIVRRARTLRRQAGRPAHDLTDAGAVARAAGRGDPACAAVWEEAKEAILTLSWDLTVLFDPDVFVLGGGVAAGIPSLRDEISRHLAAQAWSGFDPPRVIPASPEAPLLGAALSAWQVSRGH